MNCARCDYRAEDLTEHAFASGHRLCVVCQRRSLTEFEAQTCTACVGRVRADLADIATGYALLEPAGVVALTLLGDGTMQRLFRAEEWASYGVTVHPLSRDGEQVVKPIRDEWASDPLPVVAALASWEDFWRADFGDPVGPAATLTGVVGYLTGNLDTGHRAAQTHPAFDEFAAELTRLRAMVQHGAGLADVPVEADAKCFDCGGPLLRTYRPSGNGGLRRQGLDWEGLTDDWTCGRCRRVYDQPSYFLALRAAPPEEVVAWQRPTVAAWLVDRPFRTVQAWMRDLAVLTVCDVETRRQFVWMPDVQAKSADTGRVDGRRAG